MAQKFVGVDLGTHHVKIVVLTTGIRGVQVLDVIESPVGGPTTVEEGEARDPLSQRIAVALTSLRDRGLLGHALGVSLPASLLSYRVLTFPFTDERRIAQVVGFEADGQFAVPIDELMHGHLVLPPLRGEGRALVVAARRERVEQIIALFRRAGSDVKVVTSPAIAAAQVCHVSLPPAVGADARVPSGALLVDLGHQFSHFVAIGPKGPVAVRTLRRAGKQVTDAVARYSGLDGSFAEAAKHASAFVPHHGLDDLDEEQLASGRWVAEALEPVMRELEHTRLWLRGDHHLEVRKILLAGGTAELKGIAAYVSEQTGLPVEIAAPGARGLRFDAAKPWHTALSALGAAYGAARTPLLQLHDEANDVMEGGWLPERMTSVLTMGVAILAFGALDTIVRMRASEAELSAHKDQLAELSERVFGESLGPEEVGGKLAEADGDALNELIPRRGALDVLAMITDIAKPSDGLPPAVPAAVAPGEEDPESAGGPPIEPTGVTGGLPGSLGPIAPDAGVVAADALTFSTIEISERKIGLHVSADTSSAQDRLASKLGQTGCMSNILKGKVKGNERRKFEMSLDHNCYRSAPTDEQDTGR